MTHVGQKNIRQDRAHGVNEIFGVVALLLSTLSYPEITTKTHELFWDCFCRNIVRMLRHRLVREKTGSNF